MAMIEAPEAFGPSAAELGFRARIAAEMRDQGGEPEPRTLAAAWMFLEVARAGGIGALAPELSEGSAYFLGRVAILAADRAMPGRSAQVTRICAALDAATD